MKIVNAHETLRNCLLLFNESPSTLCDAVIIDAEDVNRVPLSPIIRVV